METDPAIKGWNVPAVRAPQRSIWTAFTRKLALDGPLGFSFYSDPDTYKNLACHNIVMSYAYVLGLCALESSKISMLDWGGGLGHYGLLNRALYPQLIIDYYCKDVELLVAEGGMGASYRDETEKIIDQLTTLGINKIAVFYQDDAFGKSGLAGVERALAKRNLKVVATGAFDKAKNDVRDAVKAIGAVDPQGVVMISTYKLTAAFVREMRQAGKLTQFFALSVVGYKALQAELGNDVFGIAISQVVPYPWSGTLPVVREFNTLPIEIQPKSGATYTTFEGPSFRIRRTARSPLSTAREERVSVTYP